MGRTLSVGVHVEGLNDTLAAFRRLPRQADKDLRERTLAIAQVLALRVASAARSDNAQTALMAPTVRAVRGRTPTIVAGGTTLVGARHVPAYKIVFGTEFGSSAHLQFRPHLGRGSYWMWRTVQANEARVMKAWEAAADDIERHFDEKGGA